MPREAMVSPAEEYVVNYEQSVGAPELTPQDRQNINELRASLAAMYKGNEHWVSGWMSLHPLCLIEGQVWTAEDERLAVWLHSETHLRAHWLHMQDGEVMGPLFADDSLFRYLWARNGDIKKAEKMLVKTLE